MQRSLSEKKLRILRNKCGKLLSIETKSFPSVLASLLVGRQGGAAAVFFQPFLIK